MSRRAKGSRKPAESRIKVHNVPSRGRSTRVALNGTVLHQLSDLETRLEAELEWCPEVTLIRSQVDLPLDRTKAIAEQLGIKHPRLRTGDAAVMSTDFYFEMQVDGRTSRHARAVKPSNALQMNAARPETTLNRTVAKLEIERRYWKGEGVEWRLVTDRHLDRTRCSNLRLLLSLDTLDPEQGEAFWQDVLELTAKALAKGSDHPITYLAKKCAERGKLREKDFVACVRHLCSLRLLTFDMSKPFTPELRASDFEFVGQA